MNRIGGLATIPSRGATLPMVIESIIDQLDVLYVTLNTYKEIPAWIRRIEKIKPMIGDNQHGDAMKFVGADTPNVYFFSFDDDLLYPKGYCDYLDSRIAKHGGIVSLHGRNYPRPIVSFRKWIANYRCLGTVTDDFVCDIGGTGVMAFDTNHFKVTIDDFKLPNMADVWISKLAHEQEVTITVLKHNNTYLQYIPNKHTIWNTARDVGKQTEILKSFLT